VTVTRVATAALAALAILLGINLVGATSRFVTAFEVYDRLEMRMPHFYYSDPDTPIATTFEVTNPTRQEVLLMEIELGLNAGVRRVGGGLTRPMTRLGPGETLSFDINLAINDRGYVRRLETDEIDWRVRGRMQIQIEEGIDPVWISFIVRYLEE
jgi:hypothetical protein